MDNLEKDINKIKKGYCYLDRYIIKCKFISKLSCDKEEFDARFAMLYCNKIKVIEVYNNNGIVTLPIEIDLNIKPYDNLIKIKLNVGTILKLKKNTCNSYIYQSFLLTRQMIYYDRYIPSFYNNGCLCGIKYKDFYFTNASKSFDLPELPKSYYVSFNSNNNKIVINIKDNIFYYEKFNYDTKILYKYNNCNSRITIQKKLYNTLNQEIILHYPDLNVMEITENIQKENYNCKNKYDYTTKLLSSKSFKKTFCFTDMEKSDILIKFEYICSDLINFYKEDILKNDERIKFVSEKLKEVYNNFLLQFY